MKIEFIKCDRCGAKLTLENSPGPTDTMVKHPVNPGAVVPLRLFAGTSYEVDLCKECTDDMVRWYNAKRGEHEPTTV